MTEAVVTKIKSNSITLPKTWQGSKVLLRITGNTATITKIKKTDRIYSPSEIRSWRRLGKAITKSTLKKALAQQR
jgi:hypothetical protein